jgi:hypothetical protein
LIAAARLPDAPLLQWALIAAEAIGDDRAKAQALRAALAERLPALLERALAEDAMGDDWGKAKALGALAALLPKPRLSSFLVRVQNHLSTMRRPEGLWLLTGLARVIDVPGQEVLLLIAETILDIGNRWK